MKNRKTWDSINKANDFERVILLKQRNTEQANRVDMMINYKRHKIVNNDERLQYVPDGIQK